MLQRISKRHGFRLFCEGKPVLLCPRKFRPERPFSLALTVHAREWIERETMLARGNGTKKTAEQLHKEAFESMLRNWAWFNASWETGYYRHYYREGANHV
jgi:hypothetical protein